MARLSLAVLAMSLSGCLVTSTPSYEEPERTPPFLLSSGAKPDLLAITVIDVNGDPSPVEFAAVLRSEDNGDTVFGRLVLDYGVAAPGGSPDPYQRSIRDTSAPAGTLDGPPRTLAVTWNIGTTDKPTAGCHNVTLLATHEAYVDSGCPVDPADFDFLTWTIFVCDSSQGSCCDPTAPVDQGGCPAFQCPKIDPELRCDTVLDPQSLDSQVEIGTDSGGAP